jgi:hypothetical protein
MVLVWFKKLFDLNLFQFSFFVLEQYLSGSIGLFLSFTTTKS